MNPPTPHYMLLTESDGGREPGRWRFSLRAPDGSKCLEANDFEPSIRGERLDLLTVVRALEALDEPSQVTLVGCSRYVRRGIRYGLPEWRRNGWRWEYYGQMVPVKNGDLWQRLDRALRFHTVECRRYRVDGPHARLRGLQAGREKKIVMWGVRVVLRDWLRYAGSLLARGTSRMLAPVSRWWLRARRSVWRRIARFPCRARSALGITAGPESLNATGEPCPE